MLWSPLYKFKSYVMSYIVSRQSDLADFIQNMASADGDIFKKSLTEIDAVC